MTPLNLPTYNFRFQKGDNCIKIFDRIRRKFIVLQPEEWVRQHWLHYLIEDKHYPESLLKVEMSVNTAVLKQRSDIVAYNSSGKAVAIVECKAPHVKITQDTFDQIARYNMKLQVPYLVVSNGITHFCCKINYLEKSYAFLSNLPDYQELTCN